MPHILRDGAHVTTHAQTVNRQFDPLATRYLDSAVHAAGPDLDWVAGWISRADSTAGRALDVGSGPGHLSFRLAARGAPVCAADPSEGMLALVAAEAQRRQLPIDTCQAAASHLPFADGHFDLAASRFSAHHWPDVPRALREMHRVTRPGGKLLLIDLLGEDLPLVDTHLQAIELIRDPGHVRDLTAAEWQLALQASGWRVREFCSWPLRLAFESWVGRMRVPPLRQQLLREMLSDAPAEVRQALAIEADGSFSGRVGLFLAGRE
jgi:ubiquinone/menaquinone biosynthesis C-methylase UbiE